MVARSRWGAKLAERLLEAKRSGMLHNLVQEWEEAEKNQAPLSSPSCAMKERDGADTLKERASAAVLSAYRAGDLRRLAEEMAQQAEKKAGACLEIKRNRMLDRLAQEMADQNRREDSEDSDPPPQECLKAGPQEEEEGEEKGAKVCTSVRSRVLHSILEMKRSGDLEQMAREMEATQVALEAKAAQLTDVAQRLRTGLRDAKRSGQLERLADEMARLLESESISVPVRQRLREGLLRAHRAGELRELVGELGELADIMPSMPQT